MLGGIGSTVGGGSVQQVSRRIAIHQTQPSHQTHAVGLRFHEQGIDRFGVRGGKSQRGSDPVAQQLCYEKRSFLRTVFGGCKAIFLGECVVLEPRKQAIGGRPNHVGLGVVDMHVHKTGGNDAPRQVLNRYAGELVVQCMVRAHRLHYLHAIVVRPDHQKPILIKHCGVARIAICGETKDGGAVSFHVNEAYPCVRTAV